MEAEPLYKRALKIYEGGQQNDKQQLGLILNNLGELYRKLGRDAEAEAALERSLAILEKALGPNHPDVAQGLNNLASL